MEKQPLAIYYEVWCYKQDKECTHQFCMLWDRQEKCCVEGMRYMKQLVYREVKEEEN